MVASVWVGLGLRVIVEGSCPSAAMVESLLQPMLPESEQLDGLRVYLQPIDELLQVEVRSESGAQLTSHILDRNAPCPALAAAAAVVIASTIASLPRITPPPTPPPAPPLLPPPSLPPPPPRLLWEVGAGAVLALTSPAATGGGSLEAELAPNDRRLHGRLGLRISATALGLRQQSLGSDLAATAEWTRLQLLLAPRYRFASERLHAELYAGGTAALVLVRGHGLPRSDSSQAADVGLAGGLRVGPSWGRLALWSELAFVGWLRPQEVRLVDESPRARLPAWDILISTGLSYGRF